MPWLLLEAEAVLDLSLYSLAARRGNQKCGNCQSGEAACLKF
jgi:hypothetical protein